MQSSEPWFVAKDVCECLELDLASGARGLDDDEKGLHTVQTPGGAQEMSIVSEAGLYSLILRSRKPEAKTFKRWITHEVLPAIRKHGGYLTPAKLEEALLNPDTLIRLATDLKEEREKRQALEVKAAADRPKVVFAESIEVAKTSILIGEMAKLIKQATGYDMGQNRFFDWLRANGYLHKSGSAKNMPTQRCIEAGWMEIKEGTRIGSSGECHITRTTKVTGRGQIYFVNLFKKMQEEGQ
jgi:anti-repressor protein